MTSRNLFVALLRFAGACFFFYGAASTLSTGLLIFAGHLLVEYTGDEFIQSVSIIFAGLAAFIAAPQIAGLVDWADGDPPENRKG